MWDQYAVLGWKLLCTKYENNLGANKWIVFTDRKFLQIVYIRGCQITK
jgi:hypothetical protein